MAKVFISYSHRDKTFALWLANLLQRHGVSPWIDLWEIAVGDSIVSRISEGLGTSDFLVVLLSTHSVQSNWVREEMNTGLVSTINQKGAKLLPVLLEKCELPTLLTTRKYADLSSVESRHAGLAALLTTLGVRAQLGATVLFHDEALVLTALRGKPDINWTPELVAHRLASNSEPASDLPDVHAALESLRRQGFVIVDAKGRLQLTDKAVTYFRESRNTTGGA